jgi:hypothetical protein
MMIGRKGHCRCAGLDHSVGYISQLSRGGYILLLSHGITTLGPLPSNRRPSIAYHVPARNYSLNFRCALP